MACVGRGAWHDRAADRPDFRSRAESRIRRRAGGAVHRPALPPPVLSEPTCARSCTRSIWTMVAFAILAVFLIKGICDYLANYLVNYVGFSAVTDLRKRVFDKVLTAGRAVLRIALHRPPDVVHHERHRKDSGGRSRTFWRICCARPSSCWACSSWSCTRIGGWRLVSLTVLPFVLMPTARIGRRIRRTSRRSQESRGVELRFCRRPSAAIRW